MPAWQTFLLFRQEGGQAMDAELQQIGPRLRAARHSRGWTLDELAARCGMSASTLSRLERGKRQASLELVLPVTRQLGLRLDDLVNSDSQDPRVRRPAIKRDGLLIVPLAPEGSAVQAHR